MSRVIVTGRVLTVAWAVTANGKMPAQEFYDAIEDDEKEKFLALAERLATTGKILNNRKFKKLSGTEVWEIKPTDQLRFIGDFMAPGFLVAHACRKKQDRLYKTDIRKAERIIKEQGESSG